MSTGICGACRKRFLFGSSVLVACSIFQPAVADHPAVAFGSEASGPINTVSATALPIGALVVGLRNEFIERDALSDRALQAGAGDGHEVHSVSSINSTSLSLAYGVSETVSLSLRLPWIRRNDIREAHATEDDGHDEHHEHATAPDTHEGGSNIDSHGDAAGVGDLVLLSNWRIHHDEQLDVALQAGFEAPTGATRERDRGERLEGEFQPGSGSWDGLFGIAASRRFAGFGVHANLLYKLNTEGAQHTAIGDALFYNVGVVRTIRGVADDHHVHPTHAQERAPHGHLRIEAIIELNGERRWHNRIDGSKEPNSGGDVLYFSPGLRLSFGKLSAFVSGGIPVIDDAHGEQTDVDFRLIGGLGYAF